MRRHASVQSDVLDLDAIDDDAARFAGGRLTAVLEVGAVNFAFLGETEREALIASYAAFLNSLRSPVQLVVRVVPVSLDGYIAELDRHADPGDPGPLADVARDHVAFLRRLARTRVLLDRRCYVVVTMATPRPRRSWHAPFRRRAAADVLDKAERRQLGARCDDIARQLARCGLAVRRLTSFELAELYYTCWCPELARVQRLSRDLAGYAALVVEGNGPLPALGPRRAETETTPPPFFRRRHDTGSRGEAPDDTDGERRVLMGTRSVADLIAPAATEERRDYLLVDGQYARTLVLTGYPRTVGPGWLCPIIDFDAPLELSLHIEPLETASMVTTLTRKMVQFHSSRMLAERGGRLADPEREVAYEDAERLRDRLQRGDERVFSVAPTLLVRATSLAELNDLTRRVQATAGGMLAQTRVAILEQAPGFRTCLPAGRDELGISRNLDTTSLATTFPFASSTLAMDHGALYGIARHNHAPVILDPFAAELENANAVIFAKSGAGKSYFTKVTALRMLLLGADVLVIDPEDEYRALCDALGGQEVRLAASSVHRLNPFDLPPPETVEPDAPDPLATQTAAVGGLLDVMLADPGGTLSARERAMVDQAIGSAYAAAGFTRDPATHARPTPLMRDLLSVLEHDGAGAEAGLGARLRRYVDGSLRGLFAGPTSVELAPPAGRPQVVVFNVQALEPELRPVGIHLITTCIWNQVRRRPRPRLLIVDEAWSLLQYPAGGAFLAAMARRARKYWLGLVTITQDVADFLGAEHGRTVLTNAAIKVLMKQDSTTIDPVVDAFRLSTAERQFLLGAGKGEGLLFARGSRIGIQVEASPLEHRLATTTPSERFARTERAASEPPSPHPDGGMGTAASTDGRRPAWMDGRRRPSGAGGPPPAGHAST